MFAVGGLDVDLLGAEDCADIDALLTRCSEFIRLTEGHDPGPGDGRLLLDERPEEAPDVEKLVLGLYDGPCLVGVVDLLKDFPAPGVWYLGLLLIEPARRRAGIGAALVAALGDWIASQGGRALRLVVLDQNAAGHRFWARQGFQAIGSVDQDLGHLRRTLHRMERALPI
jgi:GNAT superfamily N-acetyltransferase